MVLPATHVFPIRQLEIQADQNNNRNQKEVTNYKHMFIRIINIWKHFQCALPNMWYYSIQINNKDTLNSNPVYSNLNEFKDGRWITKMGWATKLLLAKNRTPYSKRTMIWGGTWRLRHQVPAEHSLSLFRLHAQTWWIPISWRRKSISKKAI